MPTILTVAAYCAALILAGLGSETTATMIWYAAVQS